MFPSKKVLCIVLFLFIQACTYPNHHEESLTKSKNIIVPTTALINPAIGLGSFVISTSSIQKVYSLSDLVFIADKGESIAESALSYSTKKNCKIVNIFENQTVCF